MSDSAGAIIGIEFPKYSLAISKETNKTFVNYSKLNLLSDNKTGWITTAFRKGTSLTPHGNPLPLNYQFLN